MLRLIKNENLFVLEEKEIHGQKFIAVSKKGNSLTKFISPKEYEKLVHEIKSMKEITPKILFGRKNFLYSNDREDLFHVNDSPIDQIIGDIVLEGKGDYFNIERFNSISKRANYFAKYVPGIFHPEFETGNTYKTEKGHIYYKFPTVDAILNIFAKDFYMGYEKRSDLENILMFRELASGPFKEKAKQEILKKIGDYYEFESDETKKYVLQKSTEAIEEIQKELIPQSKEAMVRVYDGKNSQEIVRKPFWYLHFNEESVGKVLADFWEQFSKQGIESEETIVSQLKQYERIINTFSEFVPNLKTLEEKRQKVMEIRKGVEADTIIQRMILEGNYSELSKNIAERCSQESREKLVEGLEKYIIKSGVQQVLSGDKKYILDRLGLKEIKILKDVYDKAIVGAAKRATNELGVVEFTNLVNNYAGNTSRANEIRDNFQRRIKSPDFLEETVSHYIQNMSIKDFSNPNSHLRHKMNLWNIKFNPIANEVIDSAQLEKLKQFSDSEILQYVNGNFEIYSSRKKSREYICERIYNILGTELEEGRSFNLVARENGLTKVPNWIKSYIASYVQKNA